MKNKKILDIMKCKNIVIPTYMLKYALKLGITEKELIFLCYLAKYGDNVLLDIEFFHSELGYDIEVIMELINDLVTKNILTINVIKNKRGISEEYLNIENYSNKIANLLIGETEEKNDTSIYSTIEKQFGRVLSPIEYETIKKWIDGNISDEMILDAVKEAILCGVFNLKYVDKILYEWNKKGYKPKKATKEKAEEIEVFDYNWLEDGNE